MSKLAVVWIVLCLIFCATPSAWSQSAEECHAKGNALLEKSEYEAALAEYSKALEVDPQFVKSRLRRGYCSYKLAKYSDAERDFQAAVDQNPKDHTALSWLGKVLIAQKMCSTAEQKLKAACDLKEECDYYVTLAYAARCLQKDDEALIAANKALALEPGNKAALAIRDKLISDQKAADNRQRVLEQLEREDQIREQKQKAKAQKIATAKEAQHKEIERLKTCEGMATAFSETTRDHGNRDGIAVIQERFGFASAGHCKASNFEAWCFNCKTTDGRQKKLQLRTDKKKGIIVTGPFDTCYCDN